MTKNWVSIFKHGKKEIVDYLPDWQIKKEINKNRNGFVGMIISPYEYGYFKKVEIEYLLIIVGIDNNKEICQLRIDDAILDYYLSE